MSVRKALKGQLASRVQKALPAQQVPKAKPVRLALTETRFKCARLPSSVMRGNARRPVVRANL
jgi:hypothetical protein